jgi:2-dehydropantoate 2-reductase
MGWLGTFHGGNVSATRSTIAVLGPGGVGGLVGGLLVRQGHRVVCLAGSGTVAALSEARLRVRSGQFGEFAVAVDAATELREPVDAVLITVKATALEAAVERVTPDALGAGLVVPLLNGVEHLALLRDRYPAEQVVAGAMRVESTRVAPGRIEHTTPFASVELASRTAPRDRVDELATVLDGSGLQVAVRDDELTMMWDKLAFLAALALMTTSYEATAGDVRTRHRDLMLGLVDEIVAVARAVGASVEAMAVVELFDGIPAGVKSSMQRDAEAGRALELDAIGGAVLRDAARHGVAVPIASQLVAGLQARYGGPVTSPSSGG